MTVQCICCRHFSMRNAGQMARLGYGHCGKESNKASFQSANFERNCAMFAPVDDDELDKRIAWLGWEKKRFFKEIRRNENE